MRRDAQKTGPTYREAMVAGFFRRKVKSYTILAEPRKAETYSIGRGR
jgi:hypothetical protein